MSLGPQFQSTVRGVTTGVTAAALGATMAVTGMTHDAPKGEWVGTEAEVQAMRDRPDTNVPKWNRQLSQQFKGFSDMSSRPKEHVPSHVVAVHQNADATRMPFDKAWSVNHDDTRANDVWAVGYR